MYKLFFDKRQEQKKWVVVYNVLFPSIFTIFGIYYAIKSYKLSVGMNNNREQIETLIVMVKELKQQNTLLNKIVLAHEEELKIKTKEYKNSKSPQLKVEDLFEGEISNEIASLKVRVTNTGGDIKNFNYDLINGLEVDKSEFPKDRQLARGNHFDIMLKNMKKTTYKIRFYITDILGTTYTQDLICTKIESGYSFRFGALLETQYTE